MLLIRARADALELIGERYDRMTDEEKDFALPFWTRMHLLWKKAQNPR